MLKAVVEPVAIDDLAEYPIKKSERLDSHYFIEFHYRRWLTSEFCLMADPAVAFYGFNLFCIAQNESPIGTLPRNPKLLARLLGMTFEAFQVLMAHEITPLYNWTECNCDGEIRLAHPVVTEMAVAAIARRRRHFDDQAKRREAKRLKDLRVMIERIGRTRSLNRPNFLERVDAYLTENIKSNRTELVVAAACDAVIANADLGA